MRPSSGSSIVSRMFSKNQLLFSSLSQYSGYACESSNSFTPYFFITRVRMVFSEANIQHRPDRCWSVRAPCFTSISKVVVLSAAASGTFATLRTPWLVTAFFAMTLARSAANAAWLRAISSNVIAFS